jgi:hypothetical protein
LRWGETVERYRYERTTLAYGPDGGTTVVRESGMVVRPDRQYIKISSRTGTREEASEVLIVGEHAWVRQPILGSGWEPAQPGQLPADPLTITLDTLEVAGPPRDIGERREADGRYCRGQSYTFDPARVPTWPAPAAGANLTAEASLWTEDGSVICGQTVRTQRDGQPSAEYALVLYDINAPLSIEPPAGAEATPQPKA